MQDKPILVASPANLAMRMLLERMRAGKHINDPAELARRRQALIKGIRAWSRAHGIVFELSDTPGRRSAKREYRIAYAGDNLAADNPEALYDALDCEMVRLMLE